MHSSLIEILFDAQSLIAKKSAQFLRVQNAFSFCCFLFSASNEMWNDCTVYEMDETAFDSSEELMKYLSSSFNFTLPKILNFNEHKLMLQILDKFREVLTHSLTNC